MTRVLLADTSAFHRAGHPAFTESWVRACERYLVAVTGPVRLEVLYSARSPRAYTELRSRLDDLRQVPCGEEAMSRAEEVQAQLASRATHHRSVKLNDLLIAAAAELAGVVVWHYDEDYDRIAKVTKQATRWIAPRGSLA